MTYTPPHRRPQPPSRKLCEFDVDTNVVLAQVTRRGEVDWGRVKRLADRYPDDAGLGTMIRTFIWETAKATRMSDLKIRKLAQQTRKYQQYSCARARSSAVEKFKRKFPRR